MNQDETHADDISTRDEARRERMSAERSDESFFEPGRNCASVRHAQRFSLLIDGEDYFRVLREAITRAERTVFILGWDIDSRMKLTPEGANDGLPDALGDFLHAIAAKKRRLRVGFRDALRIRARVAAGVQDGLAHASAHRVSDGR